MILHHIWYKYFSSFLAVLYIYRTVLVIGCSDPVIVVHITIFTDPCIQLQLQLAGCLFQIRRSRMLMSTTALGVRVGDVPNPTQPQWNVENESALHVGIH